MMNTKVVFIAGMGRSGSTVLDRWLGANEGFHSLGEVMAVWGDGVTGNHFCSCRIPFGACPFWDEVRGLDAEIFSDEVTRLMISVHTRIDSVRRLFPLWFEPYRTRLLATVPARYFDVLRRFYFAVSAVSQAQVLVDSTKNPGYLFLLDQVPEVRTAVVHLVRDSRAVTYSLSRVKKYSATENEQTQMARYGPLQASGYWLAMNVLAQRIIGGREHVRARYEEFVQQPDDLTDRVCDILGVQRVLNPAIPTYHVLGGNPSRFDQALPALTLDREWARGLSRWGTFVTTSATWPWLLAYGYPIRPRR